MPNETPQLPATQEVKGQELEDIREKLRIIDPNLGRLNQSKLRRVIQTVSVRTHHSGPLPSPDDYERYAQIIPDGAERIMKMAEKEQNHRTNTEGVSIRRVINQNGRGQIFAFLLALIAIGVGGYLIYLGHEVGGAAIGSAIGISSIISAVLGRPSKQEKSNDS